MVRIVAGKAQAQCELYRILLTVHVQITKVLRAWRRQRREAEIYRIISYAGAMGSLLQ